MLRKYDVFGSAFRMMLPVLLLSITLVHAQICPPPPGEFRTQTQGGWHSNCHGQNPGCVRDSLFPIVFPSGLTIGGGYTVHFTSSAAVNTFLPGNGTPAVLTGNLIDPPHSNTTGVFVGQLTALALNRGFGDYGLAYGFTDIGGLYLQSGPFEGWTVDQIWVLANTVLGGNTSALPYGTTISQLSDAVAAINEGFVDGAGGDGYLCPQPPCPEQPPMYVTVGEHFCLQFCGSPIKVYWCCPLEGQPVFTYQAGCLTTYRVPVGGCYQECEPLTGGLSWIAQRDSGNSECPAPGGWWSAVFTAEGSGCVCVSFDRQLAVELLDFAAFAGDQQVRVRWSTASESDNDYFEILRDGSLIRRVPGAGTTTVRTDYVWLDQSSLENGVTYQYELVAVDVNGTRHRMGVQSATPVANDVAPVEFALAQNYPNPFNPTTTISFSLVENSPVQLTVYDLTGREIAMLVNDTRDAGNYSVTFDAAGQPTGMYFYRLQAGSFNIVRKMMLMK